MNNLCLAISVVFPLFCMMALGYMLRAIGVFNEQFLKQLNLLCFKVFLPVVLFINIYKSDFFSLFSIKLIIFAITCVTILFLLLMWIVPSFEKTNSNIGVVIQGIFRSNFILFGVPIAASLYGSENTGTTAILIGFVIPLFNLLSIIALQIFSNEKPSKASIIKEVIKNPLIIGSLVAFAFVITQVKMPLLFEGVVSDIANVATPLALIILGGSFKFSGIAKYKKLLFVTIISKLIIVPAFFITISIFFGFRNMELAALMAMFASPTAVSTFTMAQKANANDELAGQIVVLDSIFSVATIFLWITTLKFFNFI